MQRLPSFLERGASRSKSQRCSQPQATVQALAEHTDALAKRPLPVPLQPARGRVAKKPRCFGELVAKVNGLQVTGASGAPGMPLFLAPPPAPCDALLQQSAPRQPLVVSQAGIIFEWGLGPPPLRCE